MLFWWLTIVFILEYARPDNFLPFILPLKLYAIIPLSLFLVSVFTGTRVTNTEIVKSTQGKFLLTILLLASISMIFAVNKNMAWNAWQAMLGYIFLFFMIAKICDSREKIIWLFRIIIGLHIWLIIQNPALLTDPHQRSYIDNVTFLGDGNDFSLSVVIALPMCLYLYQSAKGRFGRVSSIVVALVLIGAIMGTQSRGAALAVIAVVFYLWTLSSNKGKGLVVIVVAVTIVIAVASDTYLNRMETLTSYQEDGSAMGRITAWKGAVKLANERPLTGMGPGCFPVAYGSRYAPPGTPWLTAHSMYFLTLGELGYTGLLLLLGLLFVPLKKLRKIIKSTLVLGTKRNNEYINLLIAVSASLIGFAVGGAFLSVLYYPHLYVISGLMLAARNIYAREIDLKGDELLSMDNLSRKELPGLAGKQGKS